MKRSTPAAPPTAARTLPASAKEPQRRGQLRILAHLCAISLAVASSDPVPGQCGYSFTPVPNPPGLFQAAAGEAINNLGQVAGTVHSHAETYRAFFWSEETGTVVLPFPPGIISMQGHDINDLGWVVGEMYSNTAWYGFVWDGQQTTIIDRPSWANRIVVSGVNNAGQVVGTSFGSGQWGIRPFIWENGVYTDLGPLGGSHNVQGRAINERGKIVGFAYTGPMYDRHAFALEDAFYWLPEPPGTTSSNGAALNNNEFVGGRGSVNGLSTGLIWSAQEIHLLPAPSTNYLTMVGGINDAGRAVGYYEEWAGYAHDRPLLWQHGVSYDLNEYVLPGTPHIGLALDINNVGQILVGADGTAVLTPIWQPADLTGDCHVSVQDLLLVLVNFGSPLGTFPQGDVDGDGEVDLTDLAILLSHWGE